MMINTISFKIKPSYNFPFRGKKKKIIKMPICLMVE